MRKTGILAALAASATLSLGTPAHAALEAYMTIKGQKTANFTGGVTQKGREGSIGVIAVSHEVISPRDPQSGLPTGRRMHKPYVVTVEWDKALPLLYNALCTNENLTNVTIKFWTPQIKAVTGVGNEVQFLTVTLTNANIADIQAHVQNVRNPDLVKQPETLDVSFTYQKITWTWNDGGITASDDWESRADLPSDHPVRSASAKQPSLQPRGAAVHRAAIRHEETRRLASSR